MTAPFGKVKSAILLILASNGYISTAMLLFWFCELPVKASYVTFQYSSGIPFTVYIYGRCSCKESNQLRQSSKFFSFILYLLTAALELLVYYEILYTWDYKRWVYIRLHTDKQRHVIFFLLFLFVQAHNYKGYLVHFDEDITGIS